MYETLYAGTLVKVIINIAVYMTLMTPEDGIDPQSD
jgi:hypothetical protein